MVEQYCHSHNTTRQVLCTTETGNMTSYNCGLTCGKLLACGQHKCLRTCHEGPCPECILLPKNCNRCACGKTVINAQQRKSCLDQVCLSSPSNTQISSFERLIISSYLHVMKSVENLYHVALGTTHIDAQHHAIMAHVQNVIDNRILSVAVVRRKKHDHVQKYSCMIR